LRPQAAIMNIGFDAKRYFHNNTGLGNYSRTLIQGLAQYYPEHAYFLFNPKPSKRIQKEANPNVHEILPTGFLDRKLSSLWRSSGVKKDLKKLKIDLYHGLSHEIPMGIQRTGVKSVVTIHDLIFERYPEQFGTVNVQIYRKKFTHACANADRVIAISEQTKQDIIERYQTDPAKIDICYQSCNPAFAADIDGATKEQVRKTYNLPQEYFLYVGSIIERKNLLNICKALKLLQGSLAVPLVVIGGGRAYKEKVVQYIAVNKLQQQVVFLNDTPVAKNDAAFQKPETFAAIYQMAIAMIYPSYFEGFGIPVLEALWSQLPVITSNVSCMPETGGHAAYYVNPDKPEEIAAGMEAIYNSKELRTKMIQEGLVHAHHFTLEKCAASVMNVYQKLLYGTV
jgi:glycosyltransferase involved in cell wall biosynthesis